MVPAATSLKCLFTGSSTATLALADTLAEAVSPKGIRRRNGHRFFSRYCYLLITSVLLKGPKRGVSRKLIRGQRKRRQPSPEHCSNQMKTSCKPRGSSCSWGVGRDEEKGSWKSLVLLEIFEILFPTPRVPLLPTGHISPLRRGSYHFALVLKNRF